MANLASLFSCLAESGKGSCELTLHKAVLASGFSQCLWFWCSQSKPETDSVCLSFPLHILLSKRLKFGLDPTTVQVRLQLDHQGCKIRVSHISLAAHSDTGFNLWDLGSGPVATAMRGDTMGAMLRISEPHVFLCRVPPCRRVNNGRCCLASACLRGEPGCLPQSCLMGLSGFRCSAEAACPSRLLPCLGN